MRSQLPLLFLQVAVFEGKASTRPALLGLERFQKAFFLHPTRCNTCSEVEAFTNCWLVLAGTPWLDSCVLSCCRPRLGSLSHLMWVL